MFQVLSAVLGTQERLNKKKTLSRRVAQHVYRSVTTDKTEHAFL